MLIQNLLYCMPITAVITTRKTAFSLLFFLSSTDSYSKMKAQAEVFKYFYNRSYEEAPKFPISIISVVNHCSGN